MTNNDAKLRTVTVLAVGAVSSALVAHIELFAGSGNSVTSFLQSDHGNVAEGDRARAAAILSESKSACVFVEAN